MKLTFHACTKGERIALVILGATASGNVRNHRALRVLSANSNAGVHALVIGAGLIVRTVGVLHAFWPAFSIRIAAVLGYAPADAVAGAFGVRAAR